MVRKEFWFDLVWFYGISTIVGYLMPNSIRCYHSESERTWERWQWRGTPHSPKLLHYWSLTIRLFSVISRTIVGRGFTPLQRCSRCVLLSQPTGLDDKRFNPYSSDPRNWNQSPGCKSVSYPSQYINKVNSRYYLSNNDWGLSHNFRWLS